MYHITIFVEQTVKSLVVPVLCTERPRPVKIIYFVAYDLTGVVTRDVNELPSCLQPLSSNLKKQWLEPDFSAHHLEDTVTGHKIDLEHLFHIHV